MACSPAKSVGCGDVHRDGAFLAGIECRFFGRDRDRPPRRDREPAPSVLGLRRPAADRDLARGKVRVGRGRLVLGARGARARAIDVRHEAQQPSLARFVAKQEVEGSVGRVERLHVGVLLAEVVSRLGVVGPDQPYLQAVVPRGRGRVPLLRRERRASGHALDRQVHVGDPDGRAGRANAEAEERESRPAG